MIIRVVDKNNITLNRLTVKKNNNSNKFDDRKFEKINLEDVEVQKIPIIRRFSNKQFKKESPGKYEYLLSVKVEQSNSRNIRDISIEPKIFELDFDLNIVNSLIEIETSIRDRFISVIKLISNADKCIKKGHQSIITSKFINVLKIIFKILSKDNEIEEINKYNNDLANKVYEKVKNVRLGSCFDETTNIRNIEILYNMFFESNLLKTQYGLKSFFISFSKEFDLYSKKLFKSIIKHNMEEDLYYLELNMDNNVNHNSSMDFVDDDEYTHILKHLFFFNTNDKILNR